MKTYYADTNFYLRFLLRDIEEQYQASAKKLSQAQNKTINIVFLPDVILEMTYVLRSVNKLPKELIVESLTTLVKTDYLDIPYRSIWARVLNLYKNSTISLFDVYLALRAHNNGAEVLTYDKALQKFQSRL